MEQTALLNTLAGLQQHRQHRQAGRDKRCQLLVTTAQLTRLFHSLSVSVNAAEPTTQGSAMQPWNQGSDAGGLAGSYEHMYDGLLVSPTSRHPWVTGMTAGNHIT